MFVVVDLDILHVYCVWLITIAFLGLKVKVRLYAVYKMITPIFSN